jgi:hypothetical protein
VQLVADNLLVLVALAAGVFAPLSGWFAAQRSRPPVVWFVFGALIGPLALALLALAPPGRCPSCAAPVQGWPSTCRSCGRPLGATGGEMAADPTLLHADDLNGNAADPNGNAAEVSPRPRRSREPRTPPVPVRPAPRQKWRDVPASPVASQEAHAGEIVLTGVPATSVASQEAHAGEIVLTGVPATSVASQEAHAGGIVLTGVPASPVASQEAHAGEIVLTGVYMTGNAALVIGAIYALARVPGPDGDRLRVFGPVDQGQITVRHEGPLDAFEVTGLDDRVIISALGDGSSWFGVFRAIGGMRGVDLERALGRGQVSRRPTRPRSARGP